MKNYKNVEMFAKNAPSGSYAAGCPTGKTQGGMVYVEDHDYASGWRMIGGRYPWHCEACEIAG